MNILRKVKDGDDRYIKFYNITLLRYKSKKKHEEKPIFGSIGKDVDIQENCRIYHSENVKVGNNVRIGVGALIEGMGGICVGNNVIFGPDVTIWTANHNYYKPSKLPYDEIVAMKPVIIKDNVWIGAKAVIVPGITIHEGAVIAMGAVVTKDVPAGAVVGGNPAKVLKYRDMQQYTKLCNEKSFYIFSKDDNNVFHKKN